uniref:probable myosin-binding protein 5 n=1 Tax=Erigeron canadensis TaxID=72917 RepID=UPI001CB986CE|nr:probable myosin-binding protein 5 [Erigeron canadensis]
MAMSKRSFKKFVVEEMGGFPQFLLWAILEWILIASLFVDGFLAFFSSTFAKIFELEPPCVLCTRVDHALVGKNPNTYYNESICECHKKDISSLAYCHVHRKLSDIQNMCEGCLLSFATEKESDTNTNKSLLKNMQKKKDELKEEDDKKMVIKTGNGYNENILDVRRCSCCGEPLKPKASPKAYTRSFSNARASTLATTSSPRAHTCFTPTAWKTDDSKYMELRFVCDNELDMPEYDFGLTDAKKVREDMKSGIVTLVPDYEEMDEESLKTPNLLKSNKFFGIPLTESVALSPRWANKTLKNASSEKSDLLSEVNEEAPGDGDSSLQQLKTQARVDKKNLQMLSMELEEERSAAAVAASNAMAMITRLQAEKAAVQMEALQYQRMMEEQAEYDQESIQILQDLVSKRDEQVRIMESELDSYKEKYGEIRKVGGDECEVDADEYYQEEWKDDDSHSQRSIENERQAFEEPLLDFETEKYQLYSMLKNLEKHIESSALEDEQDDEEDDIENKATLKREVSVIRGRLRALEADSGFLKRTAMTLQKGEKGAELLTEIAQHLRKLRHSEETSEDISTTDT